MYYFKNDLRRMMRCRSRRKMSTRILKGSRNSQPTTHAWGLRRANNIKLWNCLHTSDPNCLPCPSAAAVRVSCPSLTLRHARVLSRRETRLLPRHSRQLPHAWNVVCNAASERQNSQRQPARKSNKKAAVLAA